MADYQQALELDSADPSVHSRIAVIHNEHGVHEYQEKNYPVRLAPNLLVIKHFLPFKMQSLCSSDCRPLFCMVGGCVIHFSEHILRHIFPRIKGLNIVSHKSLQ